MSPTHYTILFTKDSMELCILLVDVTSAIILPKGHRMGRQELVEAAVNFVSEGCWFCCRLSPLKTKSAALFQIQGTLPHRSSEPRPIVSATYY